MTDHNRLAVVLQSAKKVSSHKNSSKAGVSLVDLGIWKYLPLGHLILAVLPRCLERLDEFHLLGGWFVATEKKPRVILRWCLYRNSLNSLFKT